MDERQLRILRRLRLALLALLVLWFFSPPEWRYAVALWLPFGVALALEAQFFVVGLRDSGPLLCRDRDRGPQRADLDDLRWPGREEPREHAECCHSPPAPPPRRSRGVLRSLAEA